MNSFFDAVEQVNRDASCYMPPEVAEWGAMFEGLARRKSVPDILEQQPYAKFIRPDSPHPKGTIWHDLNGDKFYSATGSNDPQTWLPIDE